mmetsp:Transcript_11942/g.29573  ORF Transcript_11942/g.29573 Transcript_11942/m.29573 type:complete len:262 (-) Transcript_11942:338-1123(-)
MHARKMLKKRPRTITFGEEATTRKTKYHGSRILVQMVRSYGCRWYSTKARKHRISRRASMTITCHRGGYSRPRATLSLMEPCVDRGSLRTFSPSHTAARQHLCAVALSNAAKSTTAPPRKSCADRTSASKTFTSRGDWSNVCSSQQNSNDSSHTGLRVRHKVEDDMVSPPSVRLTNGSEEEPNRSTSAARRSLAECSVTLTRALVSCAIKSWKNSWRLRSSIPNGSRMWRLKRWRIAGQPKEREVTRSLRRIELFGLMLLR